jgi:hypothetical protein
VDGGGQAAGREVFYELKFGGYLGSQGVGIDQIQEDILAVYLSIRILPILLQRLPRIQTPANRHLLQAHLPDRQLLRSVLSRRRRARNQARFQRQTHPLLTNIIRPHHRN